MICAGSVPPYSGSPAPRMMLVRSKTNWYWLAGIAAMSQMIWSGSCAAISVTKSHSPLSITASTMRGGGLRCTSASTRPITRGVKPRATIRRSRAWRGSSMLIIEPKNSLKAGGMSPMFEPLPEQKSSGWRLTSRMSACFVSDQKPGPFGRITISGSSCHEIGRSRRSVAKAPSRSSSGRAQNAWSASQIWSTDSTSRGCSRFPPGDRAR